MTRMRPPISALLVALTSATLLVACNDEADTSLAPSPTPTAPAVTEAPGADTTDAPPPATEPAASTVAPSTAPETTLPPTTLPDDSLPHGPEPDETGAPGPGSSGCLTTPGAVVTVTLTDPMPGPDFCLEIRLSQVLEVVNETDEFRSLSIYQGSSENLFETPQLAPGAGFTSEAVGQVLPTGEWLLEVASVSGWLGTLWVVTD